MTSIVLQHVFIGDISNKTSGIKLRLLNPVVLQLRQNQVILAYPFKYLSGVNGKVQEIVVNYQNRKNFTGCDDTSSINPTCGIKHEGGNPVPYSEGFCCFCPRLPVNQKQTRGGQDCSLDVGNPDDKEKQMFKASAHCLHFSDVWFSVSSVSEPVIMHELFLQVFNQKYLTNGSAVWLALTHEEAFELGPKNTYQYDENKTIVATFYTASPKNKSKTIPDDRWLLIPQPMPSVEIDNLPPIMKNGATDFLLLPKNLINPSGLECDVAGVSFEAFWKQKDRCNAIKGTCLKNQPLDFWEADKGQNKTQAKRKYLLEAYGTPYKDPIVIDQDTKEHWLALEYYEPHTTVMTVEFNADDIVILTPGQQAEILKVVSTSLQKRIVIYVSVHNTGLSPAKFSVRAVKCGFQVPDSNNLTLLVPPQLTEEFVLSTNPGSIQLNEKFTCSVQVNNALYGVVAKRDVAIKPFDRCICNMHCECVCLGESLKCVPLSEEDYHAAGFQGSLPVLTAKPPYKTWFAQHPVLAFFSIFLILIVLGFIKAALGALGFTAIATLGLKSCVYQPKTLEKYSEPELKDLDVLYDTEHYPIHPDTMERVRWIRDQTLFVLNVFFFFVWPFLVIRECIRKAKMARKQKKGLVDDISSFGKDEVHGSDIKLTTESDTDSGSPSDDLNLRPQTDKLPLDLSEIEKATDSSNKISEKPDVPSLAKSMEFDSSSIKKSSEHANAKLAESVKADADKKPSELAGVKSAVPTNTKPDQDIIQGSSLSTREPDADETHATEKEELGQPREQRIKSITSDSALETKIDTRPILDPINKPYARWQKGATRITAFRK
ncbi:hapless 2-like isoform X3 [Stegodyphus dumicola]|uniref:hapless 2-like isoform X3 n=1 Tax=Stegodyphus dumicola TaxID=202533 RepID=UPI0015A9565D|nr:hapless 2-like isoform X3 [Stegodyphus dumicola]